MQKIKNSIRFCVLVSALFLISCNQTDTTSDKNDKDTTQVAANQDATSMPAYDPAMDSYHVGGKGVKRLGDTLGIKMYELIVEPGESWALHSHPDHSFYVVQGGKIALFIKATGRMDTVTFPSGMGLINGPLSDSGKNIGKTTIRGVVTDIYRPRS